MTLDKMLPVLNVPYVYKVYVSIVDTPLQGYLIMPKTGTMPKTVMVALRHGEEHLTQESLFNYRLGVTTQAPLNKIRVERVMMFYDNVAKILKFKEVYPEIVVVSVKLTPIGLVTTKTYN